MSVRTKKQIMVIIGPTASGKTALSIELAKQLNGAIISADSRQIYEGMDIGTAKITAIEIIGIPHRLIDVTTPDQPWTLAQWQQAAFVAIDEMLNQGTYPLLVGGTMQYVDSIVQNWIIPEVPANIALREHLASKPVGQLYQELIKKDPAVKSFIEPYNQRRIIRALEVIEATGEAFSLTRRQDKPRYGSIIVGLFPGWDVLENNMRQRAQQMLADGLLKETKQLMEIYGVSVKSDGWHWSQTMNYRQALCVLNSSMTPEETVSSMVQDNLRYAKRQMRWWKGRSEISWYKTPDQARQVLFSAP